MKIYIGPYVNWIGPYQIADKIPFVSEETKDKIGDWLAETWVMDFCKWIDSKKERKIKVRVDKYDTWNMDRTLAVIILPMLKQLQATKHGSPIVDDEDVPPEMRYSDHKVDEEGWDLGDTWVHHKWDNVLNQMIWSFEELCKDDDDTYMNELQNKEWNERVQKGLTLFGKYYRNLWD